MTDEQIIAWLTLEGWHPVIMDTYTFTIVNPSAQLWIGHFFHMVRPFAEHPNAEGLPGAKVGSWSDVNLHYLREAARTLMGRRRT